MASILKVDTIQDQSGNNIINESADTITIGASGDTINIVGTLQNNGSASVNGVASFGDGTALLPSIANFGDLNTGMWFPAADTIAFSEGGAEAMRINSSGAMLLGTTTAGSASAGDLVVNGGVFLGGSAAANELDDYEEGTFNITFTGSSSGSFTFTGGGQYTKIGRLVTISVGISNVTFGSYVGNLQFGLPFTSASSNTYYGGDAYYYPQANWDNVSNFIGFTPSAPASSSIGIFQLKTLEGDRQASLTNSNTNTSGQGGLYARFSLTYATA
jgi:hypothetical protein